MQRINRADPGHQAAAQRLSIALILSLSVHAAVVWAVPGRGGGADLPDFLARIDSIQKWSFNATLLPDTSAFDVNTSERSSTETAGAAGRFDTPDPHYYSAEELDVLPTPRGPIRIRQEPAALEAAALATGSLNSVRLLARIDASGRIVGLYARDSDSTKHHNAAVLRVLSDTPFNAARKDGRPVRSEVVIEFAGESGEMAARD